MADQPYAIGWLSDGWLALKWLLRLFSGLTDTLFDLFYLFWEVLMPSCSHIIYLRPNSPLHDDHFPANIKNVDFVLHTDRVTLFFGGCGGPIMPLALQNLEPNRFIFENHISNKKSKHFTIMWKNSLIFLYIFIVK